MARGNLIQGYAKGKLGSTVYSVSHGVQVSRAYNPAKYDRKSDNQIIRRAQWIAASQFYSRAIASQFKFAFENKKPNQSEQNWFMKLNWNRGVMRKYDDVSNPNYPSVGRFIISDGSLRPLQVVSSVDTPLMFIVPEIPQQSVDYDTLGYMSRCLIALGYRAGDILTFTAINTDAVSGSNQQPIVPGDIPPTYTYIQVRLDPNSTLPLESMNISIEEGGALIPAGYWGFNADLNIDQYAIGGGAIQMSRQLKNRLLVSYAELVLNPESLKALQYGQTLEWRQEVIESWKASGTAKLQGGDAENADESSVIEVESQLTFPRAWSSMNGKAVVTNRILSPRLFIERIQFYRDENYMYRGLVKDDGSVVYLPKNGDEWTAIARQDGADPHRWVFESQASQLQIEYMQVINV